MKIFDYNLLRDSTITASTENSLFPTENLYDKRKVKAFRFTGNTSENLVIYKSGQTFDGVIIDAHNLTSSATVKVQANATDSWGSPSVDETLTVRNTITYFWTAVQSYDYVRLVFEDPTNTDPIEIGMAFLAVVKDFCIRDGFNTPFINVGRAQYRTLDFSLPYVDTDDKESVDAFLDNSFGTVSLSATRQQFGTAWPFYVVAIPDEVAALPPYYSVFSGDPTFTKVEVPDLGFNLSIQVQEVN